MGTSPVVLFSGMKVNYVFIVQISSESIQPLRIIEQQTLVYCREKNIIVKLVAPSIDDIWNVKQKQYFVCK